MGGVGGVGMVPVQVPVSMANGHTVYQTVHVPVHAPHLQIIPQLQQVGCCVCVGGLIVQSEKLYQMLGRATNHLFLLSKYI